jgi:hypothetical protein
MKLAPTDFVQTKIRVRAEMQKRIVQSAKKQNRSVNAEIITRLEQSFTNDRLDEMATNIKALAEAYLPKPYPILTTPGEDRVAQEYLATKTRKWKMENE